MANIPRFYNVLIQMRTYLYLLKAGLITLFPTAAWASILGRMGGGGRVPPVFGVGGGTNI